MKRLPNISLWVIAVVLCSQCAVQNNLQTAYDHALRDEYAAAKEIVKELREKYGDEQLKNLHPVYYHLTLSELAEERADTSLIVKEARVAYYKYQLLEPEKTNLLQKSGIFDGDLAERILSYTPAVPSKIMEEEALVMEPVEKIPPMEYEKYFPQTKIHMETEGVYGEDLAITFEFVEKTKSEQLVKNDAIAKPETKKAVSGANKAIISPKPDLGPPYHVPNSAPSPNETEEKITKPTVLTFVNNPSPPTADAVMDARYTSQPLAANHIAPPVNATAKLAGMLRERAMLHDKNATLISKHFEKNAFIEYDHDNLKIDYTGFGLGQYNNHFADNATMVFCKTIDGFVDQDPKAYCNISCTVTGFADSSPIKGNGIVYKGEMGNIADLSYFSLNAERNKRYKSLSQGEYINTNDGLALMRAFFVADKLIKSPYMNMDQIGLVTYVSDDKGSEYRKVIVRLKIHDVYKHFMKDLDENELEQLKEYQQQNKLPHTYPPPDVTELGKQGTELGR